MASDHEIPTFKAPGSDCKSDPVSMGRWPPTPSPWVRLTDAVHEGWLDKTFGGLEPHKIGRFEGIRRLGKGGCGIVMLAHDPQLGREVAIKMGRPPKGDEVADDMLREARLLAKLSHPNIIKVYETGTYEGRPFLAMEHVAGIDGSRFIREAPDWESVVRVYIAAGRGLAAAHAQGLVHGDFKPGNILMGDDGIVLVSDFGKGQIISEGLRWEMGTEEYMAPEVLLTHPVSPLSDQWSFCVALWESLETVRPFPGRDLRAFFEAVRDRRLITGEQVGQPEALMTADLRRILETGLSLNPRHRFASMNALLAELEKLLPGEVPNPADAAGVVLPEPPEPAEPPPEPVEQPAEPPQPRRLSRFAVAALCAACTLGGVEVGERTGFSLSQMIQPDDPLSRAEAAAEKGDGDRAIHELHRTVGRAPSMSESERKQLAERAEQIAKTLEVTSPDHAVTAWLFAKNAFLPQ